MYFHWNEAITLCISFQTNIFGCCSQHQPTSGTISYSNIHILQTKQENLNVQFKQAFLIPLHRRKIWDVFGKYSRYGIRFPSYQCPNQTAMLQAVIYLLSFWRHVLFYLANYLVSATQQYIHTYIHKSFIKMMTYHIKTAILIHV